MRKRRGQSQQETGFMETSGEREGAGSRRSRRNRSADRNNGWTNFGDSYGGTGETRLSRTSRRNTMRRGRSASALPDLSGAAGALPGILKILIPVLFVIALIVFAVKYGPAFLQTVAGGLSVITDVLVSSFIIALILTFLVLLFIGRIFPGKAKIVLFSAIWMLAVMGKISPEFGYTVGALGVMIVGMLYLLYKMIH